MKGVLCWPPRLSGTTPGRANGCRTSIGGSSLKARHRGKQIPACERLLHKRRIAVRRRKMLAAIAADKGKGYAARDQGIGDAARRLAGEMGVEQRAVDGLAGDGVERIADIPGGADHSEARLLKHAGNIERDQELVLDHEDMRCRHRLGTFPRPEDRQAVSCDFRPAIKTVATVPGPAPASEGSRKGVASSATLQLMRREERFSIGCKSGRRHHKEVRE